MDQSRILMGVVGRPHGVRGLVRVHSYAAVPDDLAGYGRLTDDKGAAWTLCWRGSGIAQLTDAEGRAVGDRDAAARLVNRQLFVDRDRLPEPDADEFYLADLIGMEAQESGGRSLGRVRAVHDYGAGTSLELDDGMMLPFTRACVPEILVGERRLVVVLPDEVEVSDASPEASS